MASEFTVNNWAAVEPIRKNIVTPEVVQIIFIYYCFNRFTQVKNFTKFLQMSPIVLSFCHITRSVITYFLGHWQNPARNYLLE